MAEKYDLIIKGGSVFTPSGLVDCDVGVKGTWITDLGKLDAGRGKEVFDAAGLTVLPGVIDTQVHFREPGFEYKEDLETGTAAAALGGVTAIFEMPNTQPNTTTIRTLENKLARARNRAWTDFAFFAGATNENVEDVEHIERQPGCAGIKVFMGSSTGDLLVKDDAVLLEVLRHGHRRVAIHAEDEDRLRERFDLVRGGADVSMHPMWRDEETAMRATERILELARQAHRRIHVLHVSTANELPLLAANKDIATVEATPQHLTLSAPDCYERFGTMAQMNPPIREARHLDALWEAVRLGIVDVVGSDHAPHTREEKDRTYPNSPSGMPGVQTLLPLLLDHLHFGRLSLPRLVDLTSAGPQRIYDIACKGRIAVGYDADFSVVDLNAKREITAKWLAAKCGWSPFEGRIVTGWPMATIVRGNIVMRDGQLLDRARGEPVRFQDTL